MPEEHEHKPRKEEEENDAEEIREILGAVTEFIASLKEPIKELLDTLAQSLNGEKLGKEVASFYKQLIDSGIPEDMAKEMTREYFRKRLESAPNIGSIMNMFKGGFKGPTKIMIARSPKEAVKQLEALKEAYPEKAEKIEKAIKMLKALEEEEEREKEEE